MSYSLKINKDKITSFRLPLDLNKINNGEEIEIFIKDILENENKLEIYAEYNIGKNNYEFKVLYDKEKLDSYDCFFIGWSYLICPYPNLCSNFLVDI